MNLGSIEALWGLQASQIHFLWREGNLTWYKCDMLSDSHIHYSVLEHDFASNAPMRFGIGIKIQDKLKGIYLVQDTHVQSSFIQVPLNIRTVAEF